jgi:hypothetical protein
MIKSDAKWPWVAVALLCPFAAAMMGLGLERALRLFLALWFPWGVVALVLMIACVATQETRTR